MSQCRQLVARRASTCIRLWMPGPQRGALPCMSVTPRPTAQGTWPGPTPQGDPTWSGTASSTRPLVLTFGESVRGCGQRTPGHLPVRCLRFSQASVSLRPVGACASHPHAHRRTSGPGRHCPSELASVASCRDSRCGVCRRRPVGSGGTPSHETFRQRTHQPVDPCRSWGTTTVSPSTSTPAAGRSFERARRNRT